MNKKILFTDLDGTLIGSDGKISEKDIKTLEYLGEKGITRVIATGRSLFSFQKSVKIKLPIDYMIFSTGAGICEYPDMESCIINQKNLTGEDVKEIVRVFEDLGLNYMVHEKVPNNHIFHYKQIGKAKDFDHRLKVYSKYANRINSNFHFNDSAQLLSIVDNDPNDEIINKVRESLPDYNVIKTTSPFDGKSLWIEVFPNNVSKSHAAKWLTEKIGLSKENSLAIGNDYNDLDLLEWAGKSVVVENTPLDMKNKFFTVKSNEESGVSEAITAWLQNTI
ncbi:MAG: HAD family phosphatase [Desulfobacterales bacterium]|nr:HAD family phosphatase [Desulfobacterales bacterium]MCP4159222.1 HAD family phosphatase [Deltaproteobacteria bacterium]